MKKRDDDACGMPAPDYFDTKTDPNYDDGFYFPSDFHAPTPEDEEYWEDDDEYDNEDEYDEEEDEEDEVYDDPSTYAHCGDWEDAPGNCASCPDDECPLNRS